MKNHSAPNERTKRGYFAYLAEAQGHSEPTIDAAAKAISGSKRLRDSRTSRHFISSRRRPSSAIFAEQLSARSGEQLSKGTLFATLSTLKRFFPWLAGQPGYKWQISHSDADYLDLSAKDARIARATRPERVPTLGQIRHVIQSMPTATEIERRDRALIAFTILTGARDGRSHPSSWGILTSWRPRSIRTRARCKRSSRSHLSPTSSGRRRHSGGGCRLGRLPADGKALGAGRSAVSRDQGRGGRESPVRGGGSRPQALEQRRADPENLQGSLRGGGPAILQSAQLQEDAGASWWASCKTPEEYKAWSQNLGHEGVLTTFCSYGE